MTYLNLTNPVSINDRVIVEAYQKEDLKAEIKNGFAMTSQKISLKGLRLLMDAKLNDGTIIQKGYKAYFKENDLHSQPWAKSIFKSDFFEGNCMIIDLAHVEFFAPT